jgi:hypothetical protein
MRSLSGREKALAFLAGVVLLMATARTLGALQERDRILGDLRRQTELWRSKASASEGRAPHHEEQSAHITKDALLEVIAQAGRELDSVQVTQSEHGLSVVFAGGPESIWEFCRVILAAGDPAVIGFSLQSSGGRLRGTLNLAVVG